MAAGVPHATHATGSRRPRAAEGRSAQERLEEGARELLGLADQEEDAMYWVDSTGEVVVHNHLDVGRAVFKEVLKTSQRELPLEADLVLELVELSSELFSALDQCMEVMVPLLQRASSLMTAEEDKAVVVRWAWASVYQPNLEKGVVLPQKFPPGIDVVRT